jgi:glycosyltransferase involved in cell wall biosynthesis
LNQEEVAQKMNASHTFVLFSNYENLPLVLIEAMASGMNVIATRVGGIAEHMGFCKWNKLIDAKNEQQLLNALSESHREMNEINREEISAYATNHFSYESIGKQFMNAYDQALNI